MLAFSSSLKIAFGFFVMSLLCIYASKISSNLTEVPHVGCCSEPSRFLSENRDFFATQVVIECFFFAVTSVGKIHNLD